MDVVTSFFNAKLEADVFIRIPDLLVELFPDLLPSKFAKLVKSIYGLKQAVRDWNVFQAKVLMAIDGMQKCEVEPCLYFIIKPKLTVLIRVHVDDYMIATNSLKWKEWFVGYYSQHCEVNDLGILDHVVGIGLTWSATIPRFP